MKILRRMTSLLVAAMLFAATTAGGAQAKELTVTWAFLFPVPLPLPVWSVDHPDSFVTIGFLFPFWLPLPVYNYDERGPHFPRAGMEVPADTVVFIDGIEVGKAAGFRDDGVFRALPDGPHTLELIHGGETLYAAVFEVRSGEFVAPERRP